MAKEDGERRRRSLATAQHFCRSLETTRDGDDASCGERHADARSARRLDDDDPAWRRKDRLQPIGHCRGETADPRLPKEMRRRLMPALGELSADFIRDDRSEEHTSELQSQ